MANPLSLEETTLVSGDPNWSEAFGHLPVMPLQTILALDIKKDGFYVDATLGGGGHSRLILKALGEAGRLLALDVDPEPLSWAKQWSRGDKRLILKRSSFKNLGEIMAEFGVRADGVLADLGLSGRQLFWPGRGFSWKNDEPLDMRLDPFLELTAAEIVNCWSEKDLADLIYRYGEDRASRRLARFIVRKRSEKEIETTGELAAIAQRALYRPGPPPKIHPATRMFMALRIAVNGELEALTELLEKAPGFLAEKGRLVIISFHSLEDRLVKEAFRKPAERGGCFKFLNKKPLVPEDEEILANHRARSAKLRVAELVTRE